MKLKSRDRVCFATSARARVLPDDTEEITEVPAPPKTGSMIGSARCDEQMLAFVHLVSGGTDMVRVEGAGHNKLRWFGPGGRSVVTQSTIPNEEVYDRVCAQLSEVGVIVPNQKAAELDVLAHGFIDKLGIKLGTGTLYLLDQFLEALASDIKLGALEESKARLHEMEELVQAADDVVRTAEEDAARAIKAAGRERDEARARAEKAERALANLTRSFREASDLVSGT